MDITDRNVLLTGASGGIGTAIAESLAERGARLTLAGRNKEKLDLMASRLGHGHRTISADIATPGGRQRLVDALAGGEPDILINNAGTLDFGLFDEQEPDRIEAMIHLNLLAPILLTRALLPALERRPEAAIVNIGSTFGSIGHPGFASYCAAKFGLRGFTEALRRELAESNIHIHYLAPRATRTKLNSHPVTAMNESLGNATDDPAAVAAALVELIARDRGENRYLGWPEKLYVRINSLLPGLIDRALARQLRTIRDFARE